MFYSISVVDDIVHIDDHSVPVVALLVVMRMMAIGGNSNPRMMRMPCSISRLLATRRSVFYDLLSLILLGG